MQGAIVQFDPAKGFGFVKVAGQQEDIFIHQSDVANGVRLQTGMQVEFDVRTTSKGPRATNVKAAGAAAPTQPARRSNANPYTLYTIVAVAIVAVIGGALFLLFGWYWLLDYLIAINIAAFALYGYDKNAAQNKRLRVPERVLHGVELFGGTPGAFIAQRVFHHKTRKVSYRIVFWLIFAIQAAAVIWWFWRGA
jgi:uncharacterized membrane protein YsdA (DUF1294 family)/cold shock CspA family protein